MLGFRNLPIRQKLTWISVASSGVALLLAGAALVSYELFTFRQTLVENLKTEADIIGYNSASAILFRDQAAAATTLAALKARPDILAGEIRTPDGNTFARYAREGLAPPPIPRRSETRGTDHHVTPAAISVFRDIAVDGEQVGVVVLQSDLSEFQARMRGYATIVGLVLLACVVATMLVSIPLQRVISGPILHLVDVARQVSREKDYSVRASTPNRDEFGRLVATFNEMLEQIQARDTELERARDQLEQRVEERTRELQSEVAERRRAEAEVRRLNEELELRVQQRTAELAAANKELEAFSYSVSHDLRAPLRAINGYAQAFLEDYGESLDDQGRHYLQRVENASRRMERLIDDLLGLARVARAQLRRETVDLTALAHDIAADLRSADPERDATFVIADRLAAHGDATLLRLVLQNLLGNAWKYSSKTPRAIIELGVLNHGGEQVFFVRDNGAGFDMNHASKLFGAFQRMHTSAEFEGTGVGLATVQRIIHRHGGRIWAEAAVGRGASFFFTLAPAGRMGLESAQVSGGMP